MMETWDEHHIVSMGQLREVNRVRRRTAPWRGRPEWFDVQTEAVERAQWVANHEGFIVWVMTANDGRFIVSRDAWHDEVEDWGAQVDPDPEEYERLHPPT